MGTFLSNLWQPEMFSQAFMVNAFITATVVAILAALVGFFVVLRGSAFVAHALPKVGFAGAAGAVMVNTNPLFGLALFSVGGAVLSVSSEKRDAMMLSLL